MLSLELRAKLELGFELTGGMTSETVFPRTEEKILQTDYQKALEFVGSKKNMEKYHSMMDFLFCESFTKWRWHCFRFYNDEGPCLKEYEFITDAELEAYDTIMCDLVLEVCRNLYEEKLRVSWKGMQEYVQNYMAKVA